MTETPLVPTELDLAPTVTKEEAEQVTCIVHGATWVRLNTVGHVVRLRCIHAVHSFPFLARYPREAPASDES